jgi:hypothetical protein
MVNEANIEPLVPVWDRSTWNPRNGSNLNDISQMNATKHRYKTKNPATPDQETRFARIATTMAPSATSFSTK